VVELTDLLVSTPGDLLVYSELALSGVSAYDVLSSRVNQEAIKTAIKDALRQYGVRDSVEIYLTYVGGVSRGTGASMSDTVYLEYAVYRTQATEAAMAEIEDIMRSDPPTFRFTTAVASSLRIGLRNYAITVAVSDPPVAEFVRADGSLEIDDAETSGAGGSDDDSLSTTGKVLLVLLIIIVVGILGYALVVYGHATAIKEKLGGLFGRSGGSDLPTTVENPTSTVAE
jgi:hypothetical protein